MFTDVHDDMGFANLPNVRSDEHSLRGKKRTQRRWPGAKVGRSVAARTDSEIDGLKEPVPRQVEEPSQRVARPASQAGEILHWKLFRKDQPERSSNVRFGWKADIGAVAAMVVCGPAAMRRRTRRSRLLFALLAPEHDVRCEVCSGGSHHAVTERREIQPLEHRFAPTEQDR